MGDSYQKRLKRWWYRLHSKDYTKITKYHRTIIGARREIKRQYGFLPKELILIEERVDE